MPHKNIYRRYSVDISGQFMEVPGVKYRSRAAKVLRKAVKQVWLIGADSVNVRYCTVVKVLL